MLLPNEWKNILLQKFVKTSGVWRDYNESHKAWKWFRIQAKNHKLISMADLPEEPDPRNFKE